MTNCNCNKCNERAFRAISYTYTAGASLVINTGSSLANLFNGTCYSLSVCSALPVMNTVVPVFIRINGINVPLLDSIGNTMFSDQIHEGTRYNLVFGSNPAHFKTRNCGCYLSSAIAWSVPTTAAAVAGEGAES